MKQKKKAPLKTRIEHGQLVVSIGVDTLAWAAEHAPWAQRFDKAKFEYEPSFSVVDRDQFAKDVLAALLHEKEDGSTPIEDAIDKACEDALDDGSTGVQFLKRPTRPQTGKGAKDE